MICQSENHIQVDEFVAKKSKVLINERQRINSFNRSKLKGHITSIGRK